MKILVTGGTGVVGTAAILALLRAGHKVRLLSRHAEQDTAAFPESIEPFAVDLALDGSLGDAVAGCDAILHAAGIVKEEAPHITFDRVNVAGTRRLLAAAEESGRPAFVYVSSLGADTGKSKYHQSKYAAEGLVQAYRGPWTILRPGNVYGPGDETISVLLKMMRALPAVPLVGRGDQAFQPMWSGDLGPVFVQSVERDDLRARKLEFGGVEQTTMSDILDRLSAITGRKPARLNMPVWITEVGVQALEAVGGTGRELLEKSGLGAPLSPAVLEMLLEAKVIPPDRPNALVDVFHVEPTPLQDGLQMLADLLPEQLPGDGIGPIHSSTYSAVIEGSRQDAAALLSLACERIQEVMPLEFAAEPGAARQATPGSTLTARVPARGNVQVRLEERTEQRATFVTVEGHFLAGVMQLHTEDLPNAVRFNVHLASQSANVVDLVAWWSAGAALQNANWRAVVRRVVALSGGRSPDGVRQETHVLGSQQAQDVRAFAERILRQRQRREREQLVES